MATCVMHLVEFGMDRPASSPGSSGYVCDVILSHSSGVLYARIFCKVADSVPFLRSGVVCLVFKYMFFCSFVVGVMLLSYAGLQISVVFS